MNKDSQLGLKIEQDIAELIISRLEKLQITPDRAVAMAKFIVESIPENISDQQMLKIIPLLDDEFSELSSIVYKYLNEYLEFDRKEKLDLVRLQLNHYIQNKSYGRI